MDKEEAFKNAVFRMRIEDTHGGHEEEHRQEMFDIANEVIKQYVETTLRPLIRQIVNEEMEFKLRELEKSQININYELNSTVARQTEKMIKDVFEKEMDRIFKKHGLTVKWK